MKITLYVRKSDPYAQMEQILAELMTPYDAVTNRDQCLVWRARALANEAESYRRMLK